MQTTDKNLSRRNFIRLGSMTGAALTIGYAMPGLANEAAETGNVHERTGFPFR